MKAQSNYTVEQIRILRKYEKSVQWKAQQLREAQSNKADDFDEEREATYLSRKHLGQQARYQGLARAFILRKDYARIESKTRDNNKPRLVKILTLLNNWAFNVDANDVILWLES
jgi:nitrogen fixation/metabolism regulation signal transduction histidine kinase